jgi:hypothetical protein
MIDLDETYRRLARSGTPEQLAAGYQEAAQRGTALADMAQVDDLIRPIAVLATAIPPAATLNVAIHLIHMLPDGARASLFEELITTAEKSAADALHRCHHALELDSEDHGYTAEEWLTTIYDITTPLLESAHRDAEPPTVVRQAQEAISWLSRSIAELDERSAEAPAAIAEALARLLMVWLFADQARACGEPDAP